MYISLHGHFNQTYLFACQSVSLPLSIHTLITKSILVKYYTGVIFCTLNFNSTEILSMM